MNLTQAQLAKKYDLDQGTVSTVLSEFDVPVTGFTYKEGATKPRRLYDEEKAIIAFKMHFRNRAERLKKKVVAMNDRANSFREIYERAILFGKEDTCK